MRVLFLLHQKDLQFAPSLKSFLPGFITGGKVKVNEKLEYMTELDMLCEAEKCEAIVTTDYRILQILFPNKSFKDPDTDRQSGLTVLDFEGNTTYTKAGRKIVILAPLRHLHTVPHAKYLFRHFLHKLHPQSEKGFIKLRPPEVVYCDTFDAGQKAVEELAKEPLIAYDIETSKHRRITHIAFASLNKTYSFTIRDMADMQFIRAILKNDALKIAQNGKYDNLHLIHWNSPAKNYYFDTYGMMQCLFAELPRTLDFIGSFFLDDLLYWKDEITTDKALYNAKDSHVTLWAFIAWMRHAPQWAKDNYADIFPVTFPHLSSEFEGIAVDEKKWVEITIKHRKQIQDSLDSLNRCLGTTTFNPGSSTQVKSLLQILAPKTKIDSSDEATLLAVSAKHPLNSFLIGKILNYRGSLKLHSTYLDAKLWHGRVTYSSDAFGTETGRSSCRASSFADLEISPKGKEDWVPFGVQLQNIPESFKVCLKADEDFVLFEMDKAQAESRCTGYLAEEEAMIKAVEESPDFHSSNASAFFGIPFDDLWDTEAGKTKNKPIRDLSKRVNHGANYNMQEAVLIQTMGEENMWKAKALLKLPEKWGLKEIATYLLKAFDTTYPRLRDKVNGWYGELIAEWKTKQGKIVTPDNWTRVFFGDPSDNKRALNKLVAHSPQHLNVALVNRGYVKIWHELDDGKTFRMKGQIHDSIFFQVHKDHLHLADRAKKIYDDTSSIEIHGRKMFIPSDVSGPKIFWK